MRKNKLILSTISFIFIISILTTSAFAGEMIDKRNINEMELYVGGFPFGVKIASNGLSVVKFSSTQGKDASPAYLSGMREGDIIKKVNGKSVFSISDFSKSIDTSSGKEISIEVERSGKKMSFKVTPKYSQEDGRYKTGIWVKDETTGIGTVTYIDAESGAFAGLGHAICDSNTKLPVPLKKGMVLDVTINGVKKGEIGHAGELCGAFNPKRIGVLTKNCETGVYGVMIDSSCYSECEKLPVGKKNELCEGDAYIICTLDESGPQRYRISIHDINPSNEVKSFKITVTDSTLLEKAGGIVQGMSGSPIIQNGKLVGAVTHVLINDPTTGYGIFIENMLNAQSSQAIQSAA